MWRWDFWGCEGLLYHMDGAPMRGLVPFSEEMWELSESTVSCQVGTNRAASVALILDLHHEGEALWLHAMAA